MSARSHLVDAGGVRLHALVTTPSGDGAFPLGEGFLLVHGLASNAQLWRGMADRLATAGQPSVAVDQRGHGLSDRVDGFAFATLAEDLLAVVDATGLDRPVVVGQSWGGAVVLELARRHPDRVRGVVCVDGGFLDLAKEFEDHAAMQAALRPPPLAGTPIVEIERRLAERTRGWHVSALAGQLANFMLRPDGTVAPNLTLERHLTILDRLWEHRPLDRAAEVTTPTLLLPVETGDDGHMADKRKAVERMAERLPQARVHWFEGYDHDVHAQAPDEVAQVVLDALDDGFFGADG